jgi:acyl-CoA synthetase (AMP-forming)/AMP-acid ligase II
MEGFSPEAFLDLVARERVTHTFMVPTQYIGVLESAALPGADLSSLRYMLSAGSPLRQDTKEAILEHLGPGLFELYGFSEGFATICRPEQQHKRGSVGTPVIGFDLRIVDDEGRELPANEPGEIAGYGGGLMKHYHNRPAETEAAIWRDERGRTFLRSGDIGKVDEDGFLYILDRKKDMIISGGFNVFPKDIEEVVGAHPAVSDVTVIGIPDPKWGETPLALVIPVAGSDADPDTLLAWANERLAKAQRLKAVELREEFPRNALGKVIKRELRAPYWEAS